MIYCGTVYYHNVRYVYLSSTICVSFSNIVISALKNKLLNLPDARLIDSKCTRLHSLSHHTFSLEYALQPGCKLVISDLVPCTQWKRAALVGPSAQSIRDEVDTRRHDQTIVAS